MYHYVRPADEHYPGLYYLSVDDFQRQLDFFEKEFGIINKNEWDQVVLNPDVLPEGVVLTFDDGLMDHYQHVYPILKERGLWGIFYVSSRTLVRDNLLNVHKVHHLLGKYNPSQVLERLQSIVTESDLIEGFFESLQASPYQSQKMDNDAILVKKMVNYSIKPEVKDRLLTELLKSFEPDIADLATRFYMSDEHIIEMDNAGFTFGAHGHSHNLLSKFDRPKELHQEVTGSIDEINNLLKEPSDTFCYPYGGKNSWNKNVISLLSDTGTKYCFSVEDRDITVEDIKHKPLFLPRYDCNQFPHGIAHIAK